MSQNRHIVTTGIILKTYPFREIDRSFVLISPDLGIVRATAFGASKVKSRFCAVIQPFVSARFNLYYNPQDQSYKLEDVADIDTRDYIRADMRQIYLVSFYCDVLHNCYISAEEFKSYYYMLHYSLDILSECADLHKSFLFFVSKLLFLSGSIAPTDGCIVCGTQSDEYVYDAGRLGLVCQRCGGTGSRRVSRISAQLFRAFFAGRYAALKSLDVPTECFNQLYAILISSINSLFDKPLKTMSNLKIVFG